MKEINLFLVGNGFNLKNYFNLELQYILNYKTKLELQFLLLSENHIFFSSRLTIALNLKFK